MSIFLGILVAAAAILCAGQALAGSMTYLPGRGAPVRVAVSTNRGTSWKESLLKPGTTVSWPSTATNLNANGMPLDPKKSYRVKDGNISEK